MKAPAWLVAVCLTCAVIGVALRFAFLDVKAPFVDEIESSLYAVGYSVPLYKEAVDPNRGFDSADLYRRFQTLGSGRGTLDTVRAVATYDPPHPPLYFVALHAWERVFGNSLSARRSLAAVFGSLVLLAAFWLCWELFASTAVAWVVTALVALSPFELVYAQQIREYSAFALMCLVTSALLVRAFRTGSPRMWILYGVSLIVTLYTALLALFVVCAFIIYTFLRERGFTPKARSFSLATLVPLLAYVPWIVAIRRAWQSVEQANHYFSMPLTAKFYLAKVIFSVGSVFFDAEYANVRLSVFLAVALLIAAYGLIGFVTNATPNAKRFLFTLILVNALVIIGGDLVAHTGHIKAARYLYPSFLGLEIVVGFGLASALTLPSSGRTRVGPASAIGVLLLLELMSCLIALRHPSWWANNDGEPVADAARYIDHDPQAVVVTDRINALVMSNDLKSDVLFVFNPRNAQSQARNRVVFFYAQPSQLAQLRSFAQLTHASPQQLRIQGDEQVAVTAMRRQIERTSTTTYSTSYELWRFAQ